MHPMALGVTPRAPRSLQAMDWRMIEVEMATWADRRGEECHCTVLHQMPGQVPRLPASVSGDVSEEAEYTSVWTFHGVMDLP